MKTKLLSLLFMGFLLISCSVDPIEEQINLQDVDLVTTVGCAGPDNSLTISFSEALALPGEPEIRKLYLSLLEPGVSTDGSFDPSIRNLINAFNDGEDPLGVYPTTFTLVGECSDSVILTIIVVADPVQEDPCEDFTAGPDNSLTISLSEALALPGEPEIRKLFLSLLETEVPRDGSFDPTIRNLINAFNDAEVPLGDYTTIYTITEGDCSASVKLTITVIADPVLEDPCKDFTAGPDNSLTISLSEALALPGEPEIKKLYLSLLGTGVARDGSFDPSIRNLIDAFNDAEIPLGDYTTTYTIAEAECSASVKLTITVIAAPQEEPDCEDVDAGPDNLREMSVSEAAALPGLPEIRKLYLSLLAKDVPKDGVFDPSIRDLISAFNATDDPVGDYTTIYTIKVGECTDSVELTIRVVPD